MDQGEPAESEEPVGGERAGAQAAAKRRESAHRQPGVLVRFPGTQAEEGWLL